MIPDSRRLAALSSLVLQLHRGSREWPPQAFQAHACDLMADLLPLDGVLWSTESLATQPAEVVPFHSLYLHGPTRALHTRYLGGDHQHDPMRAAACTTPGTTVLLQGVAAMAMAPAEAGPGALAPPLSLAQQAFLASHGVAWALCSAWVEPLASRRTVVSVWRHDPRRPFSADELAIQQFLMPHWVETFRESRFGGTGRPGRAASAAEVRGGVGTSQAVCDPAGRLHQIDEACFALLRQEWPAWSAARVPDALADAVASAAAQPGGEARSYQGKRITVLIHPGGAVLRLEVRRRAQVDRLSPRQRQIAEQYAAGQTGPQIAQALGLSASTVNNHLGDIFRKLGVSTKIALARQLSSLP